MATSYTNPGGSGDRRLLIGCTYGASDSLWLSGNATYGTNFATNRGLLNGVTTYDAAASIIFENIRDATNDWLKFDFGFPRVIDEAKWYKASGTTISGAGAWKWQGSNDDSAWTNIGIAFGLGSDASSYTSTHTELNGNTTAYRWYRLLCTGGLTNANASHNEIEFKIDAALPAPAGNTGHWFWKKHRRHYVPFDPLKANK